MLTFADIKNYIAPFIEGGVCPEDPRVKQVVDEAVERLVQKPALTHKLLLRQVRMELRGSYVTLPRCIDRIIKARIDESYSGVYSRWYEFMDNGPGPESMDALDLVDLGEVCTCFDIPDDTGMYLMVNSDREDDGGIRLHVRGINPEGMEVRDAQNRLGEFLEIPASTDTAVKSYSLFTVVGNISKPATEGYVFLSAINPSTGEIYQLGSYSPTETIPTYRRYQINGLGYNADDEAFTASMNALVKLRPVPITHDTDQVLISNRAALKTMCQAIYYFNTGDAERGGAYEILAERILIDETINYTQPSDDQMNVQEAWSMGDISSFL